jgi:hypothetical protein
MQRTERTTVTDVPERRLVCPYCGGQIDTQMVWKDSGYMQRPHPVCGGFECTECGAEWDPHGEVEKPADALPPWFANADDTDKIERVREWIDDEYACWPAPELADGVRAALREIDRLRETRA